MFRAERYSGPIASMLFGALFIAAGADMSDGMLYVSGEPYSDPDAAMNTAGPFWFTFGTLLAAGGAATAIYRSIKD